MRVAGVLIVSALLLGAVAAGAWWSRSRRQAGQRHSTMWVDGFSAEYRYEDLKDPSKSTHGRIFANALSEPRGMRHESTFSDRTRIIVWNQQDGTHLVLDPAAKTYWRPKAEVRGRLVVSSELDRYPGEPPGTTRENIGMEQVNGREAEHIRITEPRDDGSKLVWDFWYDPRLHSMIKVVKPGVSEYEETNVHEGTQPAELFEVPKGFTFVETPEK